MHVIFLLHWMHLLWLKCIHVTTCGYIIYWLEAVYKNNAINAIKFIWVIKILTNGHMTQYPWKQHSWIWTNNQLWVTGLDNRCMIIVGFWSERHMHRLIQNCLPVDSDTDEALETRPIETIPAGPGELMSHPSSDEWSITSSNYK